jgi:hypothetical protein
MHFDVKLTGAATRWKGTARSRYGDQPAAETEWPR